MEQAMVRPATSDSLMYVCIAFVSRTFTK
jgi:hypothetical protein